MINRQLGIDPNNKEAWLLNQLLNQSCLNATHCVNATDPHGEPARVWAEGEGHADNIANTLVRHGFTIISTEEI